MAYERPTDYSTTPRTPREPPPATFSERRTWSPIRGTSVRGFSTRASLLSLGFIALIGLAYLIPLPGPMQVRLWSEALGSWFIFTYFLAHVIVTLFPIPRTPFTLMAGFLFGPMTGLAVAWCATVVSATIAFVVVRAIGQQGFQRTAQHRLLQTVNDHLARRGWLAVGSLRLIAACPFSLCNYASALSRVRLVPYLVATAVAVIPGTVAVVMLGDALTGRTSPWLLAISGTLLVMGVGGLTLDGYLGRQHR